MKNAVNLPKTAKVIMANIPDAAQRGAYKRAMLEAEAHKLVMARSRGKDRTPS